MEIGAKITWGTIPSGMVVWILDRYGRFVSPLLPSACRFHPTCSRYVVDCFQTQSFTKAFLLSVKRLSKCHPYCDGGLDPVPGTD